MKPDGWSELPLTDLAEIAGGGTPKRGEPSYWNGNVAWATPTDVTALTGRTIRRTASTITEAGLAKSSATLLPPGSLLLTTRATIGVCAIAGVAMATNQGFQNLVPRHRTCVDFLYYLIQFNKTRLDRLGAGSTFREVSKTSLRRLRFLVPPLPEQRTIAAILSSVDEAIEKTQAVIDQVKVVKRGLMQELFTRGPPGRHGRSKPLLDWRLGRVAPDLTQIPESWDLVPILSVAKLESGHTPSRRKPEYWNGSVPWISLHDTASLDGPEIVNTKQSISELGLRNSSARLLPRGTVVFSRTATVGKSTIMAREMSTTQDFANYICGPRLHNRYLMQLFRHMQPEWKRLMAGSTHKTVYMPIFRQLQILLPPVAEQEEIANLLECLDDRIAAETEQEAQLRNLKSGLMSVLLTGELRVTPEPEPE